MKEASLIQILNKADQGFLIVDESNSVSYANTTFCDLLQVDANDIVGKDFLKLLTEDSQELFEDYSDLVRAKDKARNLKLAFSSGPRVSVRMQNMDGGVLVKTGLSSFLEEDGLLSKVLETSPWFNIVTDRKGTILYQNKSVLGLDKEKTLGKSILDFIEDGDRDLLASSIVACFDSGSSEVISVLSKRTDGYLATYSVSVNAAGIDDDKVSSVNLSFTDISDTVAAKLESERILGLHKVVADNLPGGVVLVFDKDLVIKYLNGNGIEPQGFDLEMVGQNLRKVNLPFEGSEILGNCSKVLAGDAQNVEISSGSKHYSIAIAPYYNDYGEVDGGVLLSLDVSSAKVANVELEERARQLAKSNEDLEQFAYVASHDLQEPLRMIGNFVQLLEKRYKDKVDARGQTYIQFTVDGVNRMSKLIQDLLVYSRVGRLEGAFEDLYVSKVVEGVLRQMKDQLNEKKVEVEVGEMPLLVRGEKNQLATVFLNLIDNAIKFNDKPVAKVEIGGKESSTNFEFFVKDNGIGIDKNFYPKVFTIFQKLHPKEEYGGSGIGLALVKKIIERHGGNIRFESEIGKGTTFIFTLNKTII